MTEISPFCPENETKPEFLICAVFSLDTGHGRNNMVAFYSFSLFKSWML